MVSTFTAADQIGFVILALIPLLLFIIGFFCCPVTTCCRYTCKCCGSYRRRPGHFCCGGAEWDKATEEEKNDEYLKDGKGSVVRTKAAAVVLLMLGFGALILSLNGTSTLNTSYTDFFTQLKGILAFIKTNSVGVRTLMTNNKTNTLVPPLTESFFTDINSKIIEFNTEINDAKSSADPYIENVNLAALVIGVVPIVFLLITVICAVLDIRTCVPCINLCCHCIFFIPYSILAFVFLLFGLFFGNVCGERDLFVADRTAPGLISLAAVPLCNANLPFETIKSQINAVILDNSLKACDTMQSYCTNASVAYSLTRPQAFFACGSLRDPTTQCRDFASANTIIGSLSLLAGAPTACINGTTVLSSCSIALCGDYCTNPTIKNASSTTTNALHFASNGYLSYQLYILPLLDCAALYEVALRPLLVCDPFLTSVFSIGGAFLGFTMFFLAGMVVIWRGQKRFFKLPSTPDDEEPHAQELEEDEASIRRRPFTNLQRESEPSQNA